MNVDENRFSFTSMRFGGPRQGNRAPLNTPPLKDQATARASSKRLIKSPISSKPAEMRMR